MPPKGKGKSNPRQQYFQAITQNGQGRSMDTLRWCLRHGGVTVKAEDEDGRTGIQIAAAGGFSASLEVLLEFVRRSGDPSDLEEPDEDGRTALMLAAFNGKIDCCKLLVLDGKCKLDAKDEQGRNARALAAARKHDKIVAFLDNPKAAVDDDDDEEVDEAEEQRRRVFLASQKLAQNQMNTAKEQAEVHRAKVEAAEALERALAASVKPVWPEVEPILAETRRELSIRNKPPLTGETGPIDPAVWNCVCLFDLRLEIAGRTLTALPPQVGRLVDLVTLIVSNNALTALPDEVGSLSKLRNLEAAGNELTELPASLAQLAGLQVIDVSKNQIASLAPLSGLHGLVGVHAGFNQLTELPLAWDHLEHMQTLSAPTNQIKAFPPGIGKLQQLVSIDLSSNAIEQVPMELGNLSVKKLQAVMLKGNPLADPRIRRFIEDDAPTLVKDLLNHVRKNGYKGDEAGGAGKKGGGGKKGKGKGKGKAVAVEEPEDDEDGDVADLLAQLAGDLSDDEEDKKAVDVS